MGITHPGILSHSVSHNTHLDLILIQLSSNDVQGSLMKAENDWKAEVPLPIARHTSTTSHFNCLYISCVTISFHLFSNPPAVFSHPGAGPLQIPPMCTFFSLFWDRKPRRLSTKLDCNATWEALGACANTSVCQKHHMAQFYHGISTKKWKILKVPMWRYLRSLMRLVFKRTLAIFISVVTAFFQLQGTRNVLILKVLKGKHLQTMHFRLPINLQYRGNLKPSKVCSSFKQIRHNIQQSGPWLSPSYNNCFLPSHF